ncbi:MAG: hypothetical protein QF435_13440 [Arenicellales bacterium]|nr:hypothetical protein [Arenicellales bacterium]
MKTPIQAVVSGAGWCLGGDDIIGFLTIFGKQTSFRAVARLMLVQVPLKFRVNYIIPF